MFFYSPTYRGGFVVEAFLQGQVLVLFYVALIKILNFVFHTYVVD